MFAFAAFALLSLGQMDYDAARLDSDANGKPLVVVVSATWCGPCQKLKGTIKQLQSEKELEGINYTTVEIEEPVGRALASGTSIPQIVIFQKVDGEWTRERIRGNQPRETMRALFRRLRSR